MKSIRMYLFSSIDAMPSKIDPFIDFGKRSIHRQFDANQNDHIAYIEINEQEFLLLKLKYKNIEIYERNAYNYIVINHFSYLYHAPFYHELIEILKL